MQCTINVRSCMLARHILAKTRNSPNIIARQNLLIYSTCLFIHSNITLSGIGTNTRAIVSSQLYCKTVKFEKDLMNFGYSHVYHGGEKNTKQKSKQAGFLCMKCPPTMSLAHAHCNSYIFLTTMPMTARWTYTAWNGKFAQHSMFGPEVGIKPKTFGS